MTKNTGIFYGIGVGTGDPEYLTLKAVRLIQQADVIAYLKSDKGVSIALHIASEWIKKQQKMAILMPYKTNRQAANKAYDTAAEKVSSYLQQGLNVAFICEGDPLFFGSYIYLHQRLSTNYHCEIVPGISSINATTALAQIPLIQQNETLAVVTSRNTDEEILDALSNYSSVVIMKAGVARPRLLALIKQSKRLNTTCYIQRAGQKGEVVIQDVSQLTGKGDYFSLFVISS
ncbi:MAG: precorrin-2 C(20)-methyltransferase [Cocleimonas sp.]|nr:precorrin-2 C(20)-methyltransferase [Cocleimonas sp.]